MATEMVMVGCKAPNGLILNLDSYRVTDQQSKRVQRIAGEKVLLRGWAHPINKPDLTEDTGGYRLNQVPADFWAAWIKTHADSSLIKDGIILPPPAKPGLDEATAKAIDHAEVEKMFRPARDKDATEVSKFDPTS
jgi:hypothetical protein